MAGKRYILPCVVCGHLYPAHRTDSRTCSGACRVRLHRGVEDSYIAGGKLHDVAAIDIRRAETLARLRPDLFERVRAGDAHLDECDGEACRAWWDLFAEWIGRSP